MTVWRSDGNECEERTEEKEDLWMNIWEILGIEPTTDKKRIKKAYAEKTKEIHPEEKPEEFKRLHEAYQAALGYADYISKANGSGGREIPLPNAEQGAVGNTDEDAARHVDEGADGGMAGRAGEKAEEEDAQEEDTEQGNLRAYFEERQEKNRRQVDVFLKYWKEFRSPYHNQESMDWWKEYLSSEEFQDIRYHSQVLEALADEIDDKCLLGINEIKWLFWEAYGFQEGEETVYQGDQQRLYRSLYPAYEKHQKNIQYEQKWARNDKFIRIFIGIAAVAVAIICVLIPVTIHRQRENGRLFLIDYMADQYPETAFSEPERIDKEDDGSIVYTLHSSAHPDLEVTAKVEYGYVEGKRAYLVKEDYSQLLFEYYAAQYGLEGGLVTYTEGTYVNPEITEYAALFYSDIGEVDAFCERAEKMFREQEELQTIAEVAVCTEDVLFPEILLQGGVPEFPFADRQVYDLRTVEAEELSEALREAYMTYMFQYESWNITTEQYREWGAAYEKISGEWEDDDGEWHEVHDPDTGEMLCKLFIPIYDGLSGYYSFENISMPMYVSMITVGNAYYFLQDRGADLTVGEDGSGFSVTFYGNITSFGDEPSVKFYDLRDCY